MDSDSLSVCNAKLHTGFNHDEGEDWECTLQAGHEGPHRDRWIEGIKMSGRWKLPAYDCVITWTDHDLNVP